MALSNLSEQHFSVRRFHAGIFARGELLMRKDFLASSVGAAGTAAALMFFLDPRRGRRRRAFVRDKTSHAVTGARISIGKAARAVGTGTRGLATGTWSRMCPRASADDDVLAERVRSKIRRVVSRPDALDVSARNGIVTLRGDVAQPDVRRLMSRVYSLRDVKEVRNEMKTHSGADDVAGFPLARHSGDGGFLQRAQSPGVRLALRDAGGALAIVGKLYQSRRTHPVRGKVLSGAGVSLLGAEVANTGVSQMAQRK
jgi:BON domain